MCTGSVYQIKKYCQKKRVCYCGAERMCSCWRGEEITCGLMGMVIFFLTINRYNIISDVYFQKQD